MNNWRKIFSWKIIDEKKAPEVGEIIEATADIGYIFGTVRAGTLGKIIKIKTDLISQHPYAPPTTVTDYYVHWDGYADPPDGGGWLIWQRKYFKVIR